VNIAAARHMTTTAEGVETRQQQVLLRALGCAEMRLFFSHGAKREVVAKSHQAIRDPIQDAAV